jgi:hypothetical protein
MVLALRTTIGEIIAIKVNPRLYGEKISADPECE